MAHAAADPKSAAGASFFQATYAASRAAKASEAGFGRKVWPALGARRFCFLSGQVHAHSRLKASPRHLQALVGYRWGTTPPPHSQCLRSHARAVAKPA